LDEGVVLFWETDVEWQTESFTVERSGDGVNFEAIGALEGGGNTVGARRYVFVDESPFAGLNFYRLVSRDYLGEPHVSSYLDIDYDGMFDPAVFPNPVAAGQQLNVRFYGFENQELQVELIDPSGRRLNRQSFDLVEGENLVSVDTPATAEGLYFVRLFVDDYPVTAYRVLFPAR